MTCLLVYCSPFLFIENCLATKSVTTPASFIWRIKSIVRGSAHLCSTSFSIGFFSAAMLGSDFSDLLFPLKSIGFRSAFLVSSSIIYRVIS